MPKHRFGAVLICGLSVSLPAFSQGIGGFEGPSVLSRGAGTVGNRSGRAVGLRFFASLAGTYDDGIVPVSLDNTGKIPTVGGLYGVEASLGAYGTKTWRRSRLGLDYKGSYHHYAQQSYYDGSDNTLSLSFATQPIKRFQVNFGTAAGSTSRGLGAYSTVSVADAATAVVGPTALLFDNRTTYLQGSAEFVYQKTSRLDFMAGGDGYTVRRQSSALVGVNGYSLRGGVQYQYSKPLFLRATYAYTHYDFPRAFGESDIHAVQIGIVRRLTKRWDLEITGGGYKALTQGLQRVGLDPVIAELLGIGTIVQAFYREVTLPSYKVAVTGNYRLSSINFTGARTVNPGNGVYLTSQNENYTGSYSYTGIRKASFGISGGHSKLSSLGQSLGGYGQYTAGASASYKVFRHIDANARYDYRLSLIDLVGYNRRANRITIGITFSPAEVPFSWF